MGIEPTTATLTERLLYPLSYEAITRVPCVTLSLGDTCAIGYPPSRLHRNVPFGLWPELPAGHAQEVLTSVARTDAQPERTELQQVIVRMPPPMHAAIKEEAAKRDLTMSQLVRAAIRAHIDDPRVLLPS